MPSNQDFGKKHKKFNAPKNDSIVVKYHNLGDLIQFASIGNCEKSRIVSDII